MKYLVIAVLVLTSLTSFSQTETIATSLDGNQMVPLYDCSIFADQRDSWDCRQLSSQIRMNLWSQGAYAVNCHSELRSRVFSRRDYNACMNIAQHIAGNPYAFNCSHYPRRSTEFNRCNITRDAYDRGYFEDTTEHRTTTRTTTRHVTDVGSVGTSCDVDYYDRSYQIWSSQKEEQRRRGQARTAIGIATTIGGLILGGSDNRTTRQIGEAMQIGGVFISAWGLVEIADANNPPPHRYSGCSKAWRGESRRVVVEQQTCTSTRYSEVNHHSSRSYYEVRCSNKTYVTYERFDPWYQGY